ncbi:MAG: ROK family protein [Fimbriimonas sp.]|nr:ROK family protein [Fimbriimonas sp.]
MAVLAIDLGGTRIKLGVVQDGQILARTILDARSQEGLEAHLPMITEQLKEIAPAQAEGIGMAFPSLVDSRTGKVTRDSGKYRDSLDLDLNAWIEREFAIPFAIENDARLATIGEWRFGAGRGFENVVMITLGTGIGTSAVIGGRVLRGPHGQAGCLGGHTIANVGGHRCPCGAIGCAEAEASTSNLDLLAHEDPGFRTSALHRESRLDYAAVFRAARQGDTCAMRLRDRSLDVWASVGISLVHAYDPEILIYGGGIMAAGEEVLGPVRERVLRDAWMPWGTLSVVPSQLGDDAALLACEWLVQSKRMEKDEIAFA